LGFRVGVLASMLDALHKIEINVKDIENNIFSGSATAVASLKLDKMPSARLALIKLCLLTKQRNRSLLYSAVSHFCFFLDLKMVKYSSSNIRFLP
jgi:hypothetical protein